MKLAILGATGAVGRTLVAVLEDRDVPVEALRLLASERSAGSEIEYEGEPVPVEKLQAGAFRGCDVAVFAAPAEVARAWAPRAWSEGCAVVDCSPAFRLDPDVPLVVPEVNGSAVTAPPSRGIVASPDAGTVALAVALAPIHAAAGLDAVVVSTYESVSGAGRAAIEQLEREVQALMNGREPDPAAPLPHRIAFNLLPAIGPVVGSGQTEGEARLADETRKVLDDDELRVSATAVRVPVFYGHAQSVQARTRRRLATEEARELLRKAPGLKVLDAGGIYPMPMLAVNDDAVLVGRIRDDPSIENGLALFLVTDNLRKGAATNAIQIASLVAQARA